MLSSFVLLISVFFCQAQKLDDVIWNAEINCIVEPEYFDFENPSYVFLRVSEFKGTQAKARFREMIEFMFGTAKSGKGSVYGFSYMGEPDFSRLSTPEDLESILNRVDTIYMEAIETDELLQTVEKYEYKVDDFSAVHINQDWFYNGKENKLKAVITDVGLMYTVHDEAGEFLGLRPLCYFKYNDRIKEGGSKSQQIDSPDILWAGAIKFPILENDAEGENHLSLKSTEYRDVATHYKVMYSRKLAQNIYMAALDGKIKAYKSADFMEVMTTEEVVKAGWTEEEVFYEDYETGELVEEKVILEVDVMDVIALDVNQSITFNSQKGTFESTINSAAVMIPKIDETGEDVGRTAIFWVKF